jgi:hypothetical protein
MDHETFVGIVHDLPNDFNLTLAVLHPGNKTVSQGSWNIETESYNPFELVDGDLRLSLEPHTYPDAFGAFADFLNSHCGVSTRILIEYPTEQELISSVFAQLVTFIIRGGFGSCLIDSSDDPTIVHFREIPQEQKPPGMKDEIVFLANAKARAYAMILFDVETCTASEHALASALIAMNPHLHYYLKSRGQVFSSQDIALFLENPRRFNPLVVTARTVYFLSKTSLFSGYDAEDLHLEYALALKRFSFLPSGEALKFALLWVCKQIGLRVHCAPVQDPMADKLSECVAFDPSQPFPVWISKDLLI